MEQHQSRDRILKDIIEDRRRVPSPPEELVDIPRYKIVRDGVQSIPKQTISAPEVAVTLIKNEIKIQHNHFGDGIEVMVLILLNLDNYPILTKTVAVGSSGHVSIDPADVFSLVLSPHFGTKGFILGHNHPSGHIFMSEEDKSLLKDYIRWGRDFNRPLRDFLIIGDGSEKYYSHRNSEYEL